MLGTIVKFDQCSSCFKTISETVDLVHDCRTWITLTWNTKPIRNANLYDYDVSKIETLVIWYYSSFVVQHGMPRLEQKPFYNLQGLQVTDTITMGDDHFTVSSSYRYDHNGIWSFYTLHCPQVTDTITIKSIIFTCHHSMILTYNNVINYKRYDWQHSIDNLAATCTGFAIESD